MASILIFSLNFLTSASVSWGADALTDQQVIQHVRTLLQQEPSFMGPLARVVTFNGLRTLVIPFRSSRDLSVNSQAIETATNLLIGFIAGGRAAIAAEHAINSVTVFVLGGAKNVAFQASVLHIGLLMTGVISPEAFVQDNLLFVDLDTLLTR